MKCTLHKFLSFSYFAYTCNCRYFVSFNIISPFLFLMIGCIFCLQFKKTLLLFGLIVLDLLYLCYFYVIYYSIYFCMLILANRTSPHHHTMHGHNSDRSKVTHSHPDVVRNRPTIDAVHRCGLRADNSFFCHIFV